MKITTKMINEFVRLYTTTDLSTYDIAKKFNISSTSVKTYLKNQGVTVKRKTKRKAYKKYYKDKYCIVLYDMNNTLYKIFDNGYQLREFLGKSNDAVYRMLNPEFIDKKLRYKGNWYYKVLIEVD